jgi:Polyketide cyclase / dehydrase and lipid transport
MPTSATHTTLTTVRGAAPISLGAEACWQNLRDLTRARHYVPGLLDSVVTTDLEEGVGASRIVTHRRFGEMNETVVAWDVGRGMTLRLHKGDKAATPFKEAFFRYELKPASPPSDLVNSCEIHTALSYAMPLGPIGRMLDRLFLRRIFRQNVIDTAVCLAEHYESNAPVPSSRLPQIRSNALA